MPDMSSWDIHSPLVSFEEIPSEPGVRVVTLCHLDYPFIGVAERARAGIAITDLEKIANNYLIQVQQQFGFDSAALPADKPLIHADGIFKTYARGFDMAWLTLARANQDVGGTFTIDRIDRKNGRSKLLDRSLVMMFVQRVDRSKIAKRSLPLRSGIGIRLDAAVTVLEGGRWLVKILGSTCSRELLSVALSKNDTMATLSELIGAPADNSTSHKVFRRLFARPIASAGGFDFRRVFIDGVRILPEPQDNNVISVSGHLSAAVGSDEPAFALTARVIISKSERAEVSSLTKEPLVAHVVEPLFAYDKAPSKLVDPATLAGDMQGMRPNRSSEVLEPCRHNFPLNLKHLADPLKDKKGWFMVAQSRLVDGAKADESMPHCCTPDANRHITRPRSNDFAAASAFGQAQELFDMIDDTGLKRTDFFKFSVDPKYGPPLIMRYRSTMLHGPGRDGRTVNAQVNFDPPEGNTKRPLQIRFGLADVQRTTRRHDLIGLAADPRWSWHEFSHVLLAGSTGKLELPYVHSMGDALAAITNDPRSGLALDPRRPGDMMPPLRGLTYPWAPISRRHDRAVRLGWSWSGTFHRAARFDPANDNTRHKGYDSEQILSTTLFRLYRALGGDTLDQLHKADLVARQAAADYTVYLLLRATASLGAAAFNTPQTITQLACLISYADVSTMPASTGRIAGRVGGCVRKVVRWAFEAQGLFANVTDDVIHDAPGNPPAVDLYIDDNRPDSEGTKLRGGYMPVSLDWWQNPPAWHAKRTAMKIVGNRLTVMVCNRGSNTANGVVVTAYYARWTPGQPPPPWNRTSATWTKALPVTGAHLPTTIAPDDLPESFGPFKLPSRVGRYLVMAEVNANEDRANSRNDLQNPSDDLPCASGDVPLVDLVAGDNNLGLIVHQVP